MMFSCGSVSRKLWICDQQFRAASGSYLTALYSVANSYKTLQNCCRGFEKLHSIFAAQFNLTLAAAWLCTAILKRF